MALKPFSSPAAQLFKNSKWRTNQNIVFFTNKYLIVHLLKTYFFITIQNARQIQNGGLLAIEYV
jgi:hypothetical protein